MPIASIDLDTLETHFTTAINAIVPTHQRGREANKWKHFVRDHKPVQGTRWYRYEWAADFDTPGGAMFPDMVDTTAPLEIIVDYGGVPSQAVDKVANADAMQLRETLLRLQSTVVGLRRVDADDPPWEFVTLNKDQAQIGYLFLVRYWKERPA